MAAYDRAYYDWNQQLDDRPALRWYARVCNRLLGRQGCEVFEFGCGVGWLMRHLAPAQHVSGYDLSPFSREQTRLKTPAATVYETMAEVPRGRFDLVVSLHVLEHVPEPLTTVRELASLLRPGGTLFFVVPAMGGLGRRLRGPQWFGYRDATHISMLPEDEWRTVVETAGLTVVKEAGDGLWDAPYVGWLPRAVQLPLFGAPAALQVYLGGGRLFLPPAWSECLLLAARK